MVTFFTFGPPFHVTKTCLFPVSSSNKMLNPSWEDVALARPTMIHMNISRSVWMSIESVLRESSLSKKVRLTVDPSIHRAGAACLLSWAYRSKLVFPAASVKDNFKVLLVLLFFILLKTRMSLWSSLASSVLRIKSGFLWINDFLKNFLALCVCHLLGAQMSVVINGGNRQPTCLSCLL